MFDTMTLTKTAGGFFGAALVFLLGNWFSTELFFGEEGGGHEPQAYTIAVDDAGGGTAKPAEKGPDYATVAASADATKGEAVFAKCKACHTVEGKDGVGPHLNGSVGRPVASVAGFAYSDGLKAVGGNWEPEKLFKFLENPKAMVPGTKMGFAGLPKAEDRANIIAFLATKN